MWVTILYDGLAFLLSGPLNCELCFYKKKKNPQVHEQPSNQPTEQSILPRLQPNFLCTSELLVHHSCHMDVPFAADSLEWRWHCDVKPKCWYRRALFHWRKKCRRVGPSDIFRCPWHGSALTATRWSEWKILRIGLQGLAEACMVLSEAALYGLLMVWQKAGLAEAIAAKLVSGSNPKDCAGSPGHGHGPQVFFNHIRGIWEELYEIHNDGAYGASFPSFLEARATIVGGNRHTAKTVGNVAHSGAPPTTPSALSAMEPTYGPVEKVCNWCARVCQCHVAHTPCVNDRMRCEKAEKV